MEDLEDQVAYSSKQGNPKESHAINGHGSEANSVSYPRSCVTPSLTNNMLDFSSRMQEKRHGRPYHASKCNSTVNGAALKKAKLQPFSSSQSSSKVRKEKLGDRITALHQLVSPFGKTDTATVLLEAIGYIRSLHSQIEAMSSSYFSCGSGSRRHQGIDDKLNFDLRSRGLCLIPVSFILHGSDDDNGDVDHWTPLPLGGGGPP